MNIRPQPSSVRPARVPSPPAMVTGALLGELGSEITSTSIPFHPSSFILHPSRRSAFTMVEIAICLAIMGIALVAIIGVLPLGMNVQRENREETIINQDASVILESIRSGVTSGTDLTNYIYAITNYATQYSGRDSAGFTEINGYTYTGCHVDGVTKSQDYGLTNNARIIGLLSTPEFMYASVGSAFYPTNKLVTQGPGTGVSNRIYAYVRAMSGPAVEKPPQNNSILIEDSFTYQVLVVNAPMAQDTNTAYLAYNQALGANLHELRLTFRWPVRPNGVVSSDAPLPQTQRTMIAGSVTQTNFIPNLQNLYYYQSQSFANAP